MRYSEGPEKIFEMLVGSEALKDSLKVKEVSDAFEKKLGAQKISVPFKIERTILPMRRGERIIERDNDAGVTVGFLNPMKFEPILLNTTPYLLRQITPQLLFSLFLLGVVIISFLSLYRNLMAQQKLAGIKNEFISNITHELKTPIATVSVAIEALKNFNAMADPAKTREYLDISQNELQRLSLLVDKVLKLSMFEKKEIELKIEPVDLKSLVDEVVSSMRLQFEKLNAQVSVDVDGNSTIEGDKLHLISIIYNLLDNALKYSKGNPSIQVVLKEEAGNVQLSVTDNGIGIPPQYKDKIFEKFFRVPSGDKHNAKGYGLGLSYVLHVVKKHHGEIAVDSQPGIGSRFTIKFPKKHEQD
jgi:two-component system phosphate regulon sensor histidine kinase PhoR